MHFLAIPAVAVIRLLLPLTILRFPFWGVILAMAADASDIIIVEALGAEFGSAARYHAFDKWFDLYYLALALWMSWQWPEAMARRTATALFGWRLGGVIVFEMTGLRQVIFFAPNIFENFYLLVAGGKQFFPKFRLDSPKKLAAFLIIAAVPKIIQEYVMHYLEFSTWSFIKHTILRW